ncbi:type II toxin-antitoxin system PemK/MazF family toxin [Cellulosimicrobium marinum]|uniref:type II toxin-antitoxin system PemK/MazF family toxin n=1 Tax=Cellulosimicrobium marinum TaxID=1638992 RepID=UPI001E50AE17|nr:type II toxin-antitoxin system PemK/MazF family toxin [Cellulosimicrobium marinum]MCB7135396.1 type II toxin-antitoxin system PemK/MazF family toxin [Cellulosimicrobium marinum]
MARNRWLGLLSDAAHALARGLSRSSGARASGSRTSGSRTTSRGPASRASGGTTTAPRPGDGYPGDHEGPVRAQYAPRLDGDPDPGEIVWTWVPFEEDHSQGKDRPVLLVGTDGPWLLAVMLTSKDHSRDARDEARWGRHWLDIGSGPWDAKGRDSEVRLDRVIRVDPGAVRREGAVVGRSVFDTVVAGIAAHR